MSRPLRGDPPNRASDRPDVFMTPHRPDAEMKEAALEGALRLNPWTLSERCKRVLARYLSVESQAGRVAAREAEREREGGRASAGSRECNLQIRGRDEFLLPA